MIFNLHVAIKTRNLRIRRTAKWEDNNLVVDLTDFWHNLKGSADSGRATGPLTSCSPFADELGHNELQPIYEFEVPNTLVGLIIGIKGKTIRVSLTNFYCKWVLSSFWFVTGEGDCTGFLPWPLEKVWNIDPRNFVNIFFVISQNLHSWFADILKQIKC